MSVMLDSLCGQQRLAECAMHDELQAMANAIKARRATTQPPLPTVAPGRPMYAPGISAYGSCSLCGDRCSAFICARCSGHLRNGGRL